MDSSTEPYMAHNHIITLDKMKYSFRLFIQHFLYGNGKGFLSFSRVDKLCFSGIRQSTKKLAINNSIYHFSEFILFLMTFSLLALLWSLDRTARL